MPTGEKARKNWADPVFRQKMKDAHKNRVVKHGFSGRGKRHRIYQIWQNMKWRCKDKSNPTYGGKGIRVEWASFEDFRDDMLASYNRHVAKHGERNTTIDRLDNNKGYSKANCRWATRKVQANNQVRSNSFIPMKSCLKGHKYTDRNTYYYVSKTRSMRSRICRICNRARKRSFLASQRMLQKGS